MQATTRSKNLNLCLRFLVSCWFVVRDVDATLAVDKHDLKLLGDEGELCHRSRISAGRKVDAGHGSLRTGTRIRNWSGGYRNGGGLVSSLNRLGSVFGKNLNWAFRLIVLPLLWVMVP